MILLALYAAFIWYLAVRLRRRWSGFTAVFLGAGALLIVSQTFVGEHAVGRWLPEGIQRGMADLLVLLIPEAVLVLFIGLYICCLPRPRNAMQCQNCGYHLGGLSPLGLVCPECGAEWKGPGSGREDPPMVLTPRLTRVKRRRVNL